MTAMMRQIRKQTLTMLLGVGLLAAVLPGARADGLDGLIDTDPLTGVALDGFDPVSYFTEADPLPGLPDYEYDWQGVPWYFANAANRDVFMRNPEVYAPQFGGHATTALSEGYLSDGDPRLYLVVAQRLYLFYSPATRDGFIASPGRVIEAASKHWAAFAASHPAPDTTAATSAGGLVASAATATNATPFPAGLVGPVAPGGHDLAPQPATFLAPTP
jgi:YHS domain-containing protein